MKPSLETAALATLAALGLGLIAAPYGMGVIFEHQYQEALSRWAEASGLKVDIANYQRGWFTSEARLAAHLSPPYSPAGTGARAMVLNIHQRIEHGPLYSSTGTALGGALAVVTSTLTLPPQISKALTGVLEKQAVAGASTVVALDSTSRTELELAAFSRPYSNGADTLAWHGMRGTLAITEGGTRIVFRARAPGLDIRTSEGQHVTLKGLRLRGDYRRGAHELWLGKTHWTLRLFDAGGLPGSAGGIALEKLTLTAWSSAQGDSQDSLNSGLKIAFDKLVAGGRSLDTGLLDLELRKLDAATVALMNKEMKRLRTRGASPQDVPGPPVQLLQQAVPRLLARSPELDLKRLAFTTDQGAVNGRLLLTVDKAENLSLAPQDLPLLLNKVRLEAELTLPVNMLRDRLTTPIRQRLMNRQDPWSAQSSVSDADIARAVRQQLAMLEGKGYLIRRGTQYQSRLRFKAGRLTINNHPADDVIGMVMMGR